MIEWFSGISPTKRFIAMFLVAGALATAFIAIANATRIAEPWWFATRGYVINRVTEQSNPIVRRLITMQLAAARNSKRQIETDIANKRFLLKTSSGIDSDIRLLIEQQLRDLADELKSVNDDIEELRRQERVRSAG